MVRFLVLIMFSFFGLVLAQLETTCVTHSQMELWGIVAISIAFALLAAVSAVMDDNLRWKHHRAF